MKELESAARLRRRRERRNRRMREAFSKFDLGERFKVIDSLGDGGLGTVLKVEDTTTKTIIAVKVLNPLFARDFLKRKRFEREIKMLETLDHPNIVAVLGYGSARNGLPFMVMDFIEGITLAEKLKEVKFLAFEEALPIFIAIAEALESAHFQGIIHRDLKPNNVMLIETEGEPIQVKLVDFGISKLRQEGGHRTTNLTQAGEIFHTPYYMSPEQCQGEEIDKRSDIYSFGCLMYETLTGRPPFFGSTPVVIIMQHLADRPKPFSRVNPENQVPPIAELLVMQCLEKFPHKRFQTVTELKNALASSRDLKPTQSKPANKLIKSILFVLFLIFVVEIVFFTKWTGKDKFVINALESMHLQYSIIGTDPLNPAEDKVIYEAFGAHNQEEAFMNAVKKKVPLFGAKLNGIDLRGKRIEGAVLHNVDFVRADLSGAEFIDCQMHGSLIQNSTAIGTTFTRCSFAGGTFDSCDFSYARFEQCEEPLTKKHCRQTGASFNGVSEQLP